MNKKFRKKACRGLRKDKKVQKHKSAKWHGNEEQTNIYVYHMLQSCGVQAGSYPKIEVKKWISYPWPQKSYLDFEILVFILPKLDYHQWLKVHTYAIWEIQTSRRMQHVGIIKTVYCSKNKLSRDLCSPGSHQLLQLQSVSQISKKIWTLLLILSCLWLVS